jgi:hypothetical protein
LEELEALAKAQSDDAAAEQEARAAKMREIGAKGGRRSRGRSAKAQAVSEVA